MTSTRKVWHVVEPEAVLTAEQFFDQTWFEHHRPGGKYEVLINRTLTVDENYVSLSHRSVIYNTPHKTPGFKLRQFRTVKYVYTLDKQGRFVIYAINGKLIRNMVFHPWCGMGGYSDHAPEESPEWLREFHDAVVATFGDRKAITRRIMRERRTEWADWPEERWGSFRSDENLDHFKTEHKDRWKGGPVATVKRMFGDLYTKRVLKLANKLAQDNEVAGWYHQMRCIADWCNLFGNVDLVLNQVEEVLEETGRFWNETPYFLSDFMRGVMEALFSERRLIAIMVRGTPGRIVMDAIREASQLTFEEVAALGFRRNLPMERWQQIHDEASRLNTERGIRERAARQAELGHQPIRRYEPSPVSRFNIPLPKGYEGLQYQPLEGTDYTIVFPESNFKMIEWSNHMQNCISGYADQATRDEFIYLGLYKDGELVVNVEIIDGGLRQLLGKYNQNVRDAKAIAEALLKVGLVTDEYSIGGAWGIYDPNDEPF